MRRPKKESVRTMGGMCASVIDVMNGKAGERKVGTDGVKDRSLRGGQKKKECHEEVHSSSN